MVFEYANEIPLLKNELLIFPALILFGMFAIYLCYIAKNPKGSLVLIICSSWFVIFEPAPTDILGAFAIIASLLNIFYYRRSFPGISIRDILLYLFLILNLNNVMFNDGDFRFSLGYFLITAYLIVMGYSVSNLSDSYYLIRKQVMLFFIPCFITCCGLILAHLGQLSILNIGPLRDMLVFENRPKAFFKDPNVAGPSLLLPAMYSLVAFFNTKGLKKNIFLCSFSLLFFGIFSTFSRGAILALMCGSFVVLLVTIDRRNVIRTISGIIVVIGGITLLVLYVPKASLFERMTDREFGVMDRTARIEEGLGYFFESPIIGTGMELHLKRAPHDTYFLLLQQTGLMGFLCFWLPIVSLAWKLLRNSRYCADSNDKTVLVALGASLVSHMILGVGVYIIHWRHLWYIVGLSIAAVGRIDYRYSNSE